MIGTRIYKDQYDPQTYAAAARWCNSNNAQIVQYQDYYEVQAVPQPPVQQLKPEVIQQLWRNYKTHQTTYVDAQDLILANTLALAGAPKGTAVRNWVFALWDTYYTVKDRLEAAQTVQQIMDIDITCSFGTPPYTIRELNQEAKNLQPVA